MLVQIGLAGAGIAFGCCAANSVGMDKRRTKYAALSQGTNPVQSFIPVARMSDMLLTPGAVFRYGGQTHTYPDIKLVYWADGNPFHHHQDLTRLKQAWQKPQTIIVHEWCWNALAKRADIVLPCTTQLERRDLMIAPRDPYIVAMEGQGRRCSHGGCGFGRACKPEFKRPRSQYLRGPYALFSSAKASQHRPDDSQAAATQPIEGRVH